MAVNTEALKNSIEQDENIIRQFNRTPRTPMKVVHQTPRKSSRKRSLFQSNSPTNSDDLGAISPLSVSSSNSNQSCYSPQFSPNGKFTTPPRTPAEEEQGRFHGRKVKVKSSLFPSLKLASPKTRKIPSTPVRESELTTPVRKSERIGGAKTGEDAFRDLTPPTSSRKTNRISYRTIEDDDSDSSQNISSSTPTHWSRKNEKNTLPETKREIKTISTEYFYGPPRMSQKPRREVSMDILGSETGRRKRVRSISLESVTSNRSYVSGSGINKKRKTSDIFSRPRTSRQGRSKEHFPGVWHGIKKPKKKKLNKNSKKHFLSPKSRIMKMIESENSNKIEPKPKPLFELKPRRRIATRNKKNVEPFDDEIIDPFPHSLIKRKCLPSAPHPSKNVELDQELAIPNPNKKFMKYGTRKAVFTLNENVTLQYSEGKMKLQTPKKRRKLYSGKNDVNFDFCDYEEKDNMKENIENILNKLDNDSDIASQPKKTSSNPEVTEKISEDQLLSILNSPNTKINLVNATPTKVLTEITNVTDSKLVTNLSSLVINEMDVETSAVKDFSQDEETQIVRKAENEITLEKTGSMLTLATNILSNGADTPIDGCLPAPTSETDELENSKEKYFSLFYKENWNSSSTNEGIPNKNSAKKKSVKVPDDQYLLDAGQKSIGIVTCPKCGVMYQAGDFADEATHKNFHEHLPDLRFTGWTNERVVGKYLDGRIIMVVNADSKSWWHKVTKIVDIVDQELGFPEGSVNALFYKTVYLFVSEKAKQIVGCLIAEECKEAFKMFPPLEGVEVDSCSKDPSPCRVGISRIWTALNYRRQGVATRMIECLQRTFFFGEIVPIDSVAFSVPSPSGKLLAQKVTGKLDFLVYGFV